MTWLLEMSPDPRMWHSFRSDPFRLANPPHPCLTPSRRQGDVMPDFLRWARATPSTRRPLAARSRKPRQFAPRQLNLEALEDRIIPVVGATALAGVVPVDSYYDGVVRIPLGGSN